MFKENLSLYPTPDWLIDKMLSKAELRSMKNILEPSAGFGNIIERIQCKLRNSNMKHCHIDAIEIDKTNLVPILKSKGIRVIHDDFLTFNSMKHYDMIIMNPDFSEGDKHLLKAIDIQSKNGGIVICLLNAESIKNPYSNTRKDLVKQLKRYNAEIEFIKDAFNNSDSMRNTKVETALIYVNIPNSRQDSIIVDYLKQEEKHRTEQKQANEIVGGNYIEQVVQQYNFEIKAGVRLIQEYESMLPYMSKDFGQENPILKLCLNDSNRYNDTNLINNYIEQIRYKYWSVLFQSKEFSKLFTTSLRKSYMEKLDELKNYDFSLFNIEQIKLDMQLLLSKSLTDTIMDLFEDFTYRHSYYPEFENNMHYYNGWVTNKCEKINDKKIVLRLSGYDDYDGRFYPTKWGVKDKLLDIEKVFNYLDSGRTQFDSDIYETLKKAQEEGQTKRVEFKYWLATFFKKGTCHLEWKDKELVRKFNVFAAINKNNLPPSYGKKSYSDMTKEEQDVIDSFQGKEEYEKIIQDKNFYLSGAGGLLAIGGTVA